MDSDFLTILALLVFGHALGDYPLQNDYMARGKNWKTPVPGMPWYYLLSAHAVIHGGLAGIATGSLTIGLLETLAHFSIDILKNKGAISVHVDQALHLLCKALWAVLVVAPNVT